MPTPIILASSSRARQHMLNSAGVSFSTIKPSIDEESIKASLLGADCGPDEIADQLAETKARKISNQNAGCLVIGSDQVLSLGGKILNKPTDKKEALEQLLALRKTTHILYSAAVIYADGKPQWRVTKPCRMVMRDFTETYALDYIDRNWDEIRYCVGCYQIEAEGSRLFAQISGDQFSIMGMPLIEILNHLTLTKAIEG